MAARLLDKLGRGFAGKPKESKRVLPGQSTVEYAMVLAAFLAMLMALGALWHLFDFGTVIDHALQSASHHVQNVSEGAWLDVFLY